MKKGKTPNRLMKYKRGRVRKFSEKSNLLLKIVDILILMIRIIMHAEN